MILCATSKGGQFIIDVVMHLHQKPAKLGFRALVLSPTRELAQQTHREFERIAEGTTIITILALPHHYGVHA